MHCLHGGVGVNSLTLSLTLILTLSKAKEARDKLKADLESEELSWEEMHAKPEPQSQASEQAGLADGESLYEDLDDAQQPEPPKKQSEPPRGESLPSEAKGRGAAHSVNTPDVELLEQNIKTDIEKKLARYRAEQEDRKRHQEVAWHDAWYVWHERPACRDSVVIAWHCRRR